MIRRGCFISLVLLIVCGIGESGDNPCRPDFVCGKQSDNRRGGADPDPHFPYLLI